MKTQPHPLGPAPATESAPSLQIRVHAVDGSVQTFTEHDDLLVKYTLDGFQPARLFTQQRITIVGSRSLTTFWASRVSRIDLVTQHRPSRDVQLGLVDAVELTESAFRALMRDLRLRPEGGAAAPSSTSFTALLEVSVVGGERLFLAQEMEDGPRARQVAWFDSLFTTSSFSFLMRTGGISILNVANLLRFTISPGPVQTSAEVWHAHDVQCAERTILDPSRPSRKPVQGIPPDADAA